MVKVTNQSRWMKRSVVEGGMSVPRGVGQRKRLFSWNEQRAITIDGSLPANQLPSVHIAAAVGDPEERVISG